MTLTKNLKDITLLQNITISLHLRD